MNINRTFWVLITVFFLTTAADATTIDFEAQGAGAPSTFNTTLNSPLVIDIATLTGGELLKNETVSVPPAADTSAVYATTAFLAGYTDPLVITFAQPVSNVSLLVTNETPDTYTLADNLGNSSSMAISNNVNQTLSLVDGGVTQVAIGTLGAGGWDYAIDNVTYTTTVPEPASAFPIIGALFGLFWRARISISANQSGERSDPSA